MVEEKALLQAFEKLQEQQNFTRAGKLFSTRNHTYFYDSGTGKVFACEGKELDLLELLLQNQWDKVVNLVEDNDSYRDALASIHVLVKEEHILQIPKYDHFTNENGDEQILEHGKLKQLTLEVTQKCNLRCKYCIYNEDYDEFRGFGQKDMEWEVAKAALDYANANGSDDIIIGFYGGEPLLNFPLVKQAIEYCLKTYTHHRELYFTMTSNLTLLTEEMAEYLAKVPCMNVVCSLDGPKNIQDHFRVFTNSVGSYDLTMAGLKLLCEKLGSEAEKRISIHSVLCPPFHKQKLDELKNFFQTIPWLPNQIGKNIAYVGAGSLKSEDGGIDMTQEFMEIANKSMKELDPVKQWALDELTENNDCLYAFQIEHSNLMKMHTRSIVDHPARRLFRNACCTPGIRKLYIAVDGTMSACERIGNSPALGNVQTSIDKNIINQKYMEEYDEYSLKHCNQCWAMHLCTNCYALCFNENGLDKKKKEEQCEACRKAVEFDLIEYYQMMEENPMVISILDQIISNGS